MLTLFPVLAAAIAVAGSAVAQTPLGTWTIAPMNPSVNAASRGGTIDANNNPVVVWDRIDKEVYAAWGVDAAFPGTRSINGLQFIVQDQEATTQDPWSLVVYTEDVTTPNPNFPDITTPVATTGNFVMPFSNPGPAAAFISVNFATPIHAPSTGDVFCGLFLQGGVASTDRLSIQAATTAVDKAGSGIIAGGQPQNFGGYYVPVGAVTPLAYAASNRLYFIQPIINGGAGVAQTITNQTTNTPSNTAPGTPSQFSGAYPDAVSPPLNAGRADDVAHVYHETGVPDGTAVLFLIDFGNFSPETLIDSRVAGGLGAIALNPATHVVEPMAFTVGGTAFHVLTIPVGIRPLLAGCPLLRQAISFDLTTNIAKAGPASRQLF